MNVTIYFRGGVGDFFIWLPYIIYLASDRHAADRVRVLVCSHWPEAIQYYLTELCAGEVEVCEVEPYSRPIAEAAAHLSMIGADLVYHMDVWKGRSGQAPRDVPLKSPERTFPDIAENITHWFNLLTIPADKTGGTVIQVRGRSVGEVAPAEWWRQGLAGSDFPKPIRLVGSRSGEPQDWGAVRGGRQCGRNLLSYSRGGLVRGN